jgi:hypothetical protein
MSGEPSRLSAHIELLRDAQTKIKANSVLGTRASFAAGYIDIAIDALERDESGMAMVALSHAVHALAHAIDNKMEDREKNAEA